MKQLFTIGKEEIETLYTDIFFVNVHRLFRDDRTYKMDKRTAAIERDWGCYLFDNQKLALFGKFWLGSVGIEGDIGLVVPPAKRDVDMLGYSIASDEFDSWSFLKCVTIPENNYRVSIRLSFSRSTFFDRPEDVVIAIDEQEVGEMTESLTRWCLWKYPQAEDSIEASWNALWKVYQDVLQAEIADERLDPFRTTSRFRNHLRLDR